MCLLQQVGHQLIGVVDSLTIILLTEERRYIWEEVERTLWLQHLHARNLFRQPDDQVAAAVEGLAHLLYAGLVTRISSFGCFLCDSCSAANGLTLQTFHSGEELFVVACQPADTVARHGVCLAHAVDNNEAVFQLRELCQCFVLACVEDMLVDLISEYHHLWVTLQYLHQCLQVLQRIDGTRWVIRRAEHEQLGVRGDSGLELLCGKAEVVLHRGAHQYAFALCYFDHLHITYPAWGRHNDLVSRTNQCLNRVAECLLGTY